MRYFHILTAVALAVAALVVAPRAAADASAPTDIGMTNSLTLSATQTTDLGNVLDIRKWENVSLTLKFVGAAGVTGNAVLTFARTASADPKASTAVWETTPRFTWTVASNGTNAVVGFTNLPRDSISAVTGLKLVSAQNTVTSNLTSVALLATGKDRSQ